MSKAPVLTDDGRRRPARIVDVARLAGVDASTASRALSDAPDRPVSSATRERVAEAAATLGYQPNALARALRTRSAGAIGMLVPSLRNPFWSQLLRGVVREAADRGYVVLLAEDDGTVDNGAAYEALVAAARIDGLIVASAHPRSSLPARLLGSGAPCVFVARSSGGSGRNVTLPEEEIARAAVDHFIALGHRLIGHVTGDLVISDIIERRVRAIRAAAAVHGLPAPAIAVGTLDEPGGEAAIRELLALPERPTAVLVTNFNQAFGVIAAARVAGLEVPGDLSVISADDDDVLGFVDPPVTAFARPHAALAAAAVAALIDQIDGGAPRDIEIDAPSTLIVRGSTGPVAARCA